MDDMRRALVGIYNNDDPPVVSGAITATAAHICGGNVAG